MPGTVLNALQVLTNSYGRDLINIQRVNERMAIPHNLGQRWSHTTTLLLSGG